MGAAVVHMDREVHSLMFSHNQCNREQLDVYCHCCLCHINTPVTRRWELFDSRVVLSWKNILTPSFGVYHKKLRRQASVASRMKEMDCRSVCSLDPGIMPHFCFALSHSSCLQPKLCLPKLWTTPSIPSRTSTCRWTTLENSESSPCATFGASTLQSSKGQPVRQAPRRSPAFLRPPQHIACSSKSPNAMKTCFGFTCSLSFNLFAPSLPSMNLLQPVCVPFVVVCGVVCDHLPPPMPSHGSYSVLQALPLTRMMLPMNLMTSKTCRDQPRNSEGQPHWPLESTTCDAWIVLSELSKGYPTLIHVHNYMAIPKH